MVHNNPNIELVVINVFTKYGQMLSVPSKDIERNRNSDINQGPKLCYRFASNDGKRNSDINDGLNPVTNLPTMIRYNSTKILSILIYINLVYFCPFALMI